MERAKVPVDLYASVGGGEHVLIGTVLAPVISKRGIDEGMFIDLSHQLTLIKNRLEFYNPNDETEE